MLDAPKLSFDQSLEVLKALGEPTRLRLARLLLRQDLTVSDLTAILGQSQPRISRHLKLLVESGILSRYQEGAWAYFRLGETAGIATLVRAAFAALSNEDPIVGRDEERLEAVRRGRAARAADYFARSAASWDRIRLLHAPDAEVETCLLRMLGDEPVNDLLDVGTGTGRLIELFAGRCRRIVGVDASRAMLAIARAKLDAAGIGHAQVRQGDCYHLPVPNGAFDLVTIHQVLHYLDDPAAALREARAKLRPGGRLLIVDFAPHALEFLRDEHAHQRLGFATEAMAGYLDGAGLEVTATETLAPASGQPDQLTVTLWLAASRAPATRIAAASH